MITYLLAPAFVSLVVSLLANYVLEAKRARRDHITKLFEVTREDVRRALEAGVDYFATGPTERKPLQEAKVIAAERELRSALPILLDSHPELENPNRDQARKRFIDLMAELTGGNFQVKSGEVEPEHIRRLTIAGAGLRAELARMRDAELRFLSQKNLITDLRDTVVASFDRRIGLSSNQPSIGKK